MSFIRSALYAAWFFVTMAIYGIPGYPLAKMSRRGAMLVMRGWCNAQRIGLRLICGVRTEVRGLENLPPGGCLIAMKHQSTYDTLAPFTFLKDPAFTPKEELRRAPMFGFYVQRAKMIFLDREGGAKSMRALMTQSKAAIEDGRQVIIFPEGTRQPVGAPPDYKPGVAGLYRALNTPCVPVALNTGCTWKGSKFPSHPGRIIFEILPPIPAGLPRDDFMSRLEAAIEQASDRLVAEASV